MTDRLPLATLSELIGRIYDCAIDPSLWSETLAELRHDLGFSQAILTLQAMPTGRVLLNVASGIPDEWLARIGDYSADIVALWGGAATIAATPLERPVLLSEANPETADGTCRNPYYLEWRRPQGIIDTLALGLGRDATSLATASFVRHESQGPIGAMERETAALLAPHLRRAVTISRLLDAQTVTAATFGSVLGLLATPVLLVDATLGLIYANPAGEDLLDRRRPLELRGGRIAGIGPGVHRAITAAIAAAILSEARIDRKGFGIPAADGDGACAIHVLPLAPTIARGDLAPSAVAAIFVAAGTLPACETGALLAGLFGFTEAERRVCERIVAGATVAEASVALGIGVATVRTHLLRIFQKAGVGRQAELVALAAALRAPVSGG